MFACVIYVSEKLKCVIPLNWVYDNDKKFEIKRHYLAYYNTDLKISAPPPNILPLNRSNKLRNNQIHKIFLYKILGKLIFRVICLCKVIRASLNDK